MEPEEEEDDPTAVLHAWLNHRQADYHQFTDDEARAIRQALLDWYPQQRRHLPWRGDPPPYTGSTAGMNTKTTKTTKTTRRTKKKRKKPEETKKSEPETTTEETNSSRTWTTPHEGAAAAVRPRVSGYGIWVSEIMLQQTRVAAVIPFWLNCK